MTIYNIKRILAITSNEQDLIQWQNLLQQIYHHTIEIVCAHNTTQAWQLLNQYPIDCILTDNCLANGDGLDFLRTLKQHHRNHEIPTIMIASNGNENIAVQALKLGAYDYIPKRELTRESLHQTLLNATELYSLTQHLQTQKAHMQHLAFYDYLTGLPNRRLFEQEFERSLARAQRYQWQLALLIVDLDCFKRVNDNYGHPCGDIVLKEVALRMQKTLRSNDMLARLSGDEFIIISEDITDNKNAAFIAERILQSLSQPILIDNIHINMTASIGIACFPDDALTAKDLIAAADSALYRAKRNHKNNYAYFNEKLLIKKSKA